MRSLLQDVRYGLRMLRKSPGFTAVAIITLALGIGANTAIFSLINAIMLRTLPVRDPQNLVLLKWTARRPAHAPLGDYGWAGCPGDPDAPQMCSFSYPMFQLISDDRRVFSSVFAFIPAGLVANANGRTSQVHGLFVSSDFFSTLGVDSALGRFLNPTDDSVTAAPAVVISYRYWKNVLGGSTPLGKSILIGKTLFTVVGVARSGSLELDPGVSTDLWLPLSFQPSAVPYLPKRTADNAIWLQLMGRLKPGVGAVQAASVITTIFAASTTSGPEAIFAPSDVPRIELPTAAYGRASLRQQFSRPLFALLAGVALILLIAAANIAGLTLARSTARRKEVAIRTALGATRGRLVRQLLTESILLSSVGGAAGIALGYWGAHALTAFLSLNWYQPLDVDVHPDLRVLGFTLFVSVCMGLVFGLAPAFSNSQLDLAPALRERGGGCTGSARGRQITVGNILVVFQMGLAMLVVVGAGLLVRTLTNLKAINTGFDPQNLVLLGVDGTYSNHAGGDLKVLHRELQERLAVLPGVVSISYSAVSLMSGTGISGTISSLDQSSSGIDVDMLPVSPNFFQTMQIPLLAGRTFIAQDSDEKRDGKARGYQAVVINEKLAHRLFGTLDPIGQHFRMDDLGSPESEVVGVVGDTKYDSLRAAVMPTIYAASDDGSVFEIRTATDSKAMMSTLRDAVNRFDGNLLITDIKTQVEQMNQNIYQERLIANLSSLFALLALVVACVGIYGLLSYQVSRRTHEIGIRLAVGAQRGDVLRLVIRQGAMLAVFGALVGVAAALAVTRYLQSFLFGVKPSDPVTIAAVALGLIAVALLASYIPARRAMKIDPMVALRYE